jgi:hypothetical protein
VNKCILYHQHSIKAKQTKMSYKASVSNIYELLNEDGDEGRRQTPQVNVGGDDKATVKKTTAAAPAKAQTKPKADSPKGSLLAFICVT